MIERKPLPAPRQKLYIGKRYQFREKVQRKNGDEPFTGKVVAAYPSYYLVDTGHFVTTVHANCIGIDIEVVEA